LTHYLDPRLVSQQVSLLKDDLHLWINQLGVGLDDFARISCEDAQIYGVKPLCEQECDYTLDQCMRDAIWLGLIRIQQMLERTLNVTLGPRYVYETKTLDLFRPTGKYLTDFAYVEKIGYKEDIVYLSSGSSVAISPYLDSGVTVESNVGGYCVAKLPISHVKNPTRTTLRDMEGHVYGYQENLWNYPRKDGDFWLIPLDNSLVPNACEAKDDLSIQSCDYMIAEITYPTGQITDIKQLVAVHPGSKMIIPYARDPEVYMDGMTQKVRLWFHPWVLSHPDFSDGVTDLRAGEFYKLYDTINLAKRVETAAAATIYYKNVLDPDDDYAYTGSASIRLHEEGAFELYDFTDPVIPEDMNCNVSLLPYRFGYWYKTNPYIEGFNAQPIEQLRKAVVHRVAAELPLTQCGCKIEEGFILNQMREYSVTRINNVTDIETQVQQYGKKEGQLVYNKTLEEIRYNRLVML
jgi:hypothetical protein